MLLSLDTREVGRVTIVRCNGRIVAGDESDSLRAHVAWLLRDRRAIVLHLGDVGFIDSSGLGTIVRTLTSTRQVRGDLKLCNVPPHINKVFELSRLTQLFDTHDSEEKAVSAFYNSRARSEAPVPTGHSILCVDCNADVIAYMRELLRRAGYEVHTSCRLSDALILMRVSHFDLVLAGPGIASSPAAEQTFRVACGKIPVIGLGSDFSTREAGEAGAGLLEMIQARISAKSA